MMASSSSSGRCKYDVFLSFRGEDTRKIFVGHLYRALQQKAINTFIDSEGLSKGNKISELLTSIEDSRLSIVVLSQNYASSTWCLKELVKILDCMDSKKQMVVPVFYQVDPSDLRKINGKFAEAFAKHGQNPNVDKEELKSWRSALTTIADLSGWDSRKYEDDSKLIEEIVENTLTDMIHTSSNEADGLVGMDSHIAEMKSRLSLQKNDVLVVGIWGMGGLGKTTIARAVFDKIACQFEHSCFLDNVKEAFINKREVQMQEALISILLAEKVQSLGLNRGWNMIKERLGMKKVLLVLDDVETSAQIEALLGKLHAFGEGSRVIVTTRNKQSLSGVNETYEPSYLRDDEALELLRKYAFRTNQPNRDYDHLSRRAMEYAQGLPLALKVLGAFLDNKIVCEWEVVLEKLKKIPQIEIQDVLRTSFEGLDNQEKDIFLDIACLFREWDKDLVTELLDSCGFFPCSGLRVLVDRALITISEDNELNMHDLLQEMGREIVRLKSKELGKRSRLWSYEDVNHVLTENTATDAVECLMLDLSNSKVELCIHPGAFVRMTKLRLLIIYYSFFYIDQTDEDFYGDTSCDGICPKQLMRWDLEFLSHELRCLLWHGCPLKSLPSTFVPKNLVKLDMRGSHIQQLWEGIKPLQNLKVVKLSHCPHLVKIPDFTEAINLKKLFLANCSSLVEVHSSVFALQKLEVLTLEGCKELIKILPSSVHMAALNGLFLGRTTLKELPSSINSLTGLRGLDLSYCTKLETLPTSIHMSSLERLDLAGCSNLGKFPEISGIMKKLRELRLDGTAIKGLPSSIDLLRGIKKLSMRNCKSLEFLTDSSCNLAELIHLDLTGCTELKTLSTSIHMSSLRTLNLNGYSNLEKFPEISGIMKELTELCLDGTAIKGLPSSINLLLGIKKLSMRNCKCLEFLTDSSCNLAELTHLDLKGCTELKTLSTSIHMSSLRTLNLNGCSNLEMFPEISGIMKELPELCLDGTAIKGLPSSINLLLGIKKLSMRNCKSLEFLTDNSCNLAELTHLDLTGCTELKTLSTSIHMSSLRTLNLNGCSNLEMFPEISGIMKELPELCLDGTAIKGLPSSINLLLGIKMLSMRNCKSLVFLPDTICNLANLKHLDLYGCSVLHNMPEKLGDLKSLFSFNIRDSGIKKLPFSILRLGKLAGNGLSCTGCKEMTAPLSAWPSSMEEYCSFSVLLHLDLSDCNLLELSDAIAQLSSLKSLKLCRNNLESLPVTMNRLVCLTHLELEACKKLKSIPELSNINYIGAHCCTALETVSTQKTAGRSLDFRFSNCFRLVQANLFRDIVGTHVLHQIFRLVQAYMFRDIVETHVLGQDNHPRLLSCNMCFPGSEIPDWFNHQCRGSSVTAQLPPNWFDHMFLGFAICTVSFFNKADHSDASHRALCYCTFKGNQADHNFSFHLQDWGFLESDHMFMAYVPWSKFSLARKGELVNKRYYTEATFKVVVQSIRNSKSEHNCMKSCGLRFFHGNYMGVQNVRMTQPAIHAEGFGAPFFPDQLEIRKSETEWEAEPSKSGEGSGMCQTLEPLSEDSEPGIESEEEEEKMVVAEQGEGRQVLGSVYRCLSLSECNMSLRKREIEREADSVTRVSDNGEISVLGSHSGLVVPNSQSEGKEEREFMGEGSFAGRGLLGPLCSCFYWLGEVWRGNRKVAEAEDFGFPERKND